MFSVVAVPASHRDLCELSDAAARRHLRARFLSTFCRHQSFFRFILANPSSFTAATPSPPSRVDVADDFICLSRTVAKWSDGVGWHRHLSSLPTRQMLILTCHQLMSTSASHEFPFCAKAHVYLIPKNPFRCCRRQTQLLVMDFRDLKSFPTS